MNTRIKELRKALDLTQQGMADRLDIKRNTIAMYEIGNIVPSKEMVFKICRTFNVNEDWLRTGTGKMFTKEYTDDSLSDFFADVLREKPEAFRRRLVSVLSGLSVEQWELLEQMARKLAADATEETKKADPED